MTCPKSKAFPPPWRCRRDAAQVDEMRRRIKATRFPERETVDDFS